MTNTNFLNAIKAQIEGRFPEFLSMAKEFETIARIQEIIQEMF